MRHEGRESLSKGGIGELADGVHVAMYKGLEVSAKALRIYAARKPAILQTTQEACQYAAEMGVSKTYACADLTISQG